MWEILKSYLITKSRKHNGHRIDDLFESVSQVSIGSYIIFTYVQNKFFYKKNFLIL